MQRHASGSDLEAILGDLANAPCWAARRGYGSFLTFDFGERLMRPTKRGTREVGAIHLWVYMAKWTLCVGRRQFNWETSWDQINSALLRFVDTSIVAIGSSPPVIQFGGPDSPAIFLAPLDDAEEGDPLFMLYLPNHRVLSATRSEQLMLGDGRESP